MAISTSVAIVGCAPRTLSLVPYDKDIEIWALGFHSDLKRVSRIFEIHPDLSFADKDYPKRIFDKKIPLYVSEEFPLKGNHVHIYPLEKASAILDGQLTSSIAYMIALAIIEEYKDIQLYGVDMDVSDNEYFYQRTAIYAWKGYAEGKGIKFTAPGSSLFKDGLYPYNYKKEGPYTESQFKLMSEQHQNKINEIHETINKLQRELDVHYGCKQVYDRLAKIGRATDTGIQINSITDSTRLK